MTKLKGDKPIRMPWEKQTDKGYTELSRAGFYSTARWRKNRNYIITKEPLCRRCLTNGKIALAVLVDHIIPIDDNSSDELKFGEENLQPLCQKCHRKKTIEDNRKGGVVGVRRGKDLMNDLEN